jgi:hypothetical protein
MASKRHPAFKDWLKDRIERPEFMLQVALGSWQETHNPAYVWWAIELCTSSDKIEFPNWVREYLAKCAQRMSSPDAAAASDLRKVLPRIMGFPAKRGRGHLLDLGAEDYATSAMKFAIEIERGARPTQALRSAFEALDAEIADRMDDKTLQSHIKNFFGIPKAPRTNIEWKRAIRAWFENVFGPFVAEYREISS